MSIEELFKAVIAALEANTKAVDRLEASLVGRAGGNSKPAKEEKPKAEVNQEPQAKEEPKPEVKEEVKPEAVAEETTSEAPALTYDNLRDLVLLLAKSGKREEIKSTFASHGIESGKDLLEKADDPASVKDHKKMAEVYADMKKLEA